MATITRNLTSGRYAVCLTGWEQWGSDSAIGDGITTALAALVGRYPTMAEAEAEYQRLMDARPSIMPGSPSVPVYDAREYRRTDYIGQQALSHGQDRDCDRRIANLD